MGKVVDGVPSQNLDVLAPPSANETSHSSVIPSPTPHSSQSDVSPLSCNSSHGSANLPLPLTPISLLTHLTCRTRPLFNDNEKTMSLCSFGTAEDLLTKLVTFNPLCFPLITKSLHH